MPGLVLIVVVLLVLMLLAWIYREDRYLHRLFVKYSGMAFVILLFMLFYLRFAQ